MAQYAGESLAKKIARVKLYLDISQHLPRDGTSRVVGLAGPEANDVSLCEAFNIAHPSRICLADLDEEAVTVAKARGATTFHGPMHQMPHPEPVDLAVFDWCGYADSTHAISAYRAFKYRVGSVICVTFARGREQTDSAPQEHLRDNAKINMPTTLDNARKVVAAKTISSALGIPILFWAQDSSAHSIKDSAPILHLVSILDYQGHSMPMGMVALKISRKYEFMRRCRKGNDVSRSEKISWHPPVKKNADVLECLRIADYLEEEGIDPAKALAVSPGTLAAWRAHRTMGTYETA